MSVALPRRAMLAGVVFAAPAAPGLAAPPALSEEADLARRIEEAIARHDALDRELVKCLARAGDLQRAVHAAEDAIGDLLSHR